MLRVLPWITDGATNFIDGYIRNIKQRRKRVRPKVFEYGAGNSTLYWLDKGCLVEAVDHDEKWVESIRKTASAFNFSDRLSITKIDRPYHDAYWP